MKIYAHNKVRAVYDISFLGIGFCFPYARTGVYRFIENLAEHLKADRDCHLELYCGSSVRHLVKSYYLKTHLQFKDTRFFDAGNGSMDRLGQELFRFSQSENRLFSKVPALLALLETSLSAAYAKQSNRGDVFHSLFYPLPRHSEFSRGSKRFLTVHDIGAILQPKLYEFDKPHLQRWIMGSIKPEDRIITPSEATKNDICNKFAIGPERVFVTYPGAAEVFYPATDPIRKSMVRKKYRIPSGPYLLAVGKLERHKNIGHLIRCFDQLVKAKNIPDLNLVLVGPEGWQHKEVLNIVERNPALHKRIFFTGFVQDEDLSALYSDALAFVFPSLFEGFGFPPLEAMQCGVPVISSNRHSLPEIIGDAGILIDPTDRDALCHSIYSLYSNPTLREELSRKSIERASEFSWKRCADQTMDAYRTAL